MKNIVEIVQSRALNIVISVNIIAIITIIVSYIISNKIYLSSYRRRLLKNFKKMKLYNYIDKKIIVINRINKNKCIKENVTPFFIIIFSVIIGLAVFLTCKIAIDINSTSIIISGIVSLLPVVGINIVIKIEKKRIKHQLPSYIINLKNHVESSNNIILAIQSTDIMEPLKKHIDKFNLMMNRGVNVQKAFEILKEEVNIKIFSSFVNAISTCYSNGGDFEDVLKRFSIIVSKENIEKEKLKETSYSAMLTLIIMVCINIYVAFAFVLRNNEYLRLIKETVAGNLILNLSIITYTFIGYLIVKIYGMEE